MNIVFCILWLPAIVGAILQGLFIGVEHQKKYVAAVCLKGSASVCFCLIGFFAYLIGAVDGGASAFTKYVFIGLIFGAVGDILLNLRFVFDKIGQKIFLAGIAAFLTGHIIYLVAIIPASESLLISVICGVVVAAILLSIIFKSFELKPAFKIFGILYIGAVVLMTSIAIGNCITGGFEKYAVLYAVGAVLFTVSDVVLIFNTFGPTSKFSLRITNLSLYYIGQLLIASSLFFCA